MGRPIGYLKRTWLKIRLSRVRERLQEPWSGDPLPGELRACAVKLQQVNDELDELVALAASAIVSSARTEVRLRLKQVRERLNSRTTLGRSDHVPSEDFAEISDELELIAVELQRLLASMRARVPRWAVFGLCLLAAAVGFVVGGGVSFKTEASPKWTDIVTALSTAALATTVLIGAYQLRLAQRQIRLTRNADQARWAIDTHREWDETLLSVRVKVATYGETPDELCGQLRELWFNGDPDYYELLREPAYWDRVAYLIRSAELSPTALDSLTGPDAAFRWRLWEPAITFMRSECGFSNAFDQFEWLARGISKEQLWQYKLRPGGHSEEYRGPR